MKSSFETEVRTRYLLKILKFLKAGGEDVGLTSNNTLNLPIEGKDGDIRWVEIGVKMTRQKDDDGYIDRENFYKHFAEFCDAATEAENF